MAFLSSPVAVIMALLLCPSLLSLSCCDDQLNKLDIPSTLSAAPAVLPADPPHESPFTELSPDVAPLLPSPGGVVPSPTGSSIPTIPSNPSPPNPDEVSVGPDSAFAPLGSSLPASSAVSLCSLMGSSEVLKFFSFMTYCSVFALAFEGFELYFCSYCNA